MVACSILLVDELVVRSGSMHPRIASVFRDDPHGVDYAGDVAEDRQDSPIECAVASHIPSIRLAYAEKRADERTRTADLESNYECAVIGCWALQGFANSA